MRFSVLMCLVFLAAIVMPVESNCGCRVAYKAVGCRKDKRNDRALPEMLVNERDKYSKYYNGINIDWMNWDEYLPSFTCRCAEAAMKKGYTYFGLQFWGECWSGPSPAANDEYDKHGSGSNCYGPGYEKCTSNSNNCVGDSNYNFIYEIIPYKCPVKFERLGCYRDKGGKASGRPLNQYILTDRDKRHAVSSGRSIDWYHFDTYLPEFACRCAQKTVEKGFNTFGVQYYGECWSGEDGDEKYYRDGETSTCVNRCYEQCHSYDPFCTGEGYTNFVYRVTTDVCEIPYQSLGCYNEEPAEAAFYELILDDVNPTSPKFMGIISTDFSDWEDYMKGLVCRCARKIKEKGYTTFAINNGGQCYSSPYGATMYAMHGASEECYHNKNTACTSGICSGGGKTNYVYQLQEENNTV